MKKLVLASTVVFFGLSNAQMTKGDRCNLRVSYDQFSKQRYDDEYRC
ncbi:hypothetical protein SAMN05880574_110102 [Chryseobacterium sp. RU37D]|nr:hypothetical protein [Chryseobacterium sp. RU37D]SIQ34087.1 hypothetical protein SAMN05880574_110102 [Chryseobacterium sp. RU37D]